MPPVRKMEAAQICSNESRRGSRLTLRHAEYAVCKHNTADRLNPLYRSLR